MKWLWGKHSHIQDKPLEKAGLTADKKYDEMMNYYSSKYGKTEGYKKAREKIAFAIAYEVFIGYSNYKTAGYYYNAAEIAFSHNALALSKELLAKAEEAHEDFEEKYGAHNGQGWFVKAEIARLRRTLGD